jgi:hypothetical protein
MLNRRRLVVIVLLVLIAGSSAVRAEAETEPNLADRFDVRWASIRYDKSITVCSQAGLRAGTESGSSEDVTLSCLIGILEPDRMVATSREASISRVTDGQGREIDEGLFPARPARYYERLRYGVRHLPRPRWMQAVRSILRLPAERYTGRFVSELRPSEMEIKLSPALLEQADGRIGRLEGYFYALVAESLEYVDVPFEPNDRWVRVTPELEIRVRKAHCTQSEYEYEIETRAPGRRDKRPLRVGYPVPGRFVVARQFICHDGRPIHPHGSPGGLPAAVSGKGREPSHNARIKAIRFVVAVNPSHCKVPFTLRNLPMLDPNE